MTNDAQAVPEGRDDAVAVVLPVEEFVEVGDSGDVFGRQPWLAASTERADTIHGRMIRSVRRRFRRRTPPRRARSHARPHGRSGASPVGVRSENAPSTPVHRLAWGVRFGRSSRRFSDPMTSGDAPERHRSGAGFRDRPSVTGSLSRREFLAPRIAGSRRRSAHPRRRSHPCCASSRCPLRRSWCR